MDENHISIFHYIVNAQENVIEPSFHKCAENMTLCP